MFGMTAIALAIAPLLWVAIQSGQKNESQTLAMTFADAMVAEYRVAFPTLADTTKTCANVQGFSTTSTAPAGSGLTASTTQVTCPTAYPGAAKVTVNVYQGAASGTPVATLATEVMVAAA